MLTPALRPFLASDRLAAQDCSCPPQARGAPSCSGDTRRASIGAILTSALLLGFAALTANPALAQKAAPAAASKYDPGASDTEIKIGNTMAYSGPAAPYGLFGKTEAAYFNKVNAEGGVNGRKITFISYDDGYNPQKTVEQTRRLVEQDGVLLIFGALGTAPNAAVAAYLNNSKVPQLFVASGASAWDKPAELPWTMGWSPNYRTEARIYGQYLVEKQPKGKVAVLYQNDDYGKDSLQGLKDGLAGKLPIVAEVSYEATDASIKAQLLKAKAAGADILFDVTTPKFAVQVIRTLPEIGWKPLHVLNAAANSTGSVLKPAGYENAQGILSGYYLKDPEDPAWKNDPASQEYLNFMTTYYPDGDKTSAFAVYGYAVAQSLVQVLKQCGNDLTRENVMRQAAALKDLRLGMFVPGIAINTSASDYSPVEQMQMARFTGERFERFGPVLSGVDPGAVSEGFKAIFRYGTATRDTSERLNANTVTMMTGTLGSTYEQIGADLATVLDDGDNLRVLPIIGRGSVQAVADILYLKGVDIGIVRTDTLDYLEKKGYSENVKKRFAYITKLFDEEMHVIAPKSIRSLSDLDGRTVAVDLPNGGTFVTAITVFERLGIRPHFLYIEQRVALDKLKRGEIDAVMAVEAKPLASLAAINDDNLHFVPVAYSAPLQDDYLPATLSNSDYPNLIAKGERVDTISVAAVLAAYNWPPKTERYRRLQHFVDTFFSKVDQLQRPPFHPKWRDLALNPKLAGWSRFQPAQQWLDRNSAATASTTVKVSDMQQQFDQFLSDQYPAGKEVPGADRPQERDALFRKFLEWQKSQPR